MSLPTPHTQHPGEPPPDLQLARSIGPGMGDSTRLPALDNLRGIAAVAVMLFHYGDFVVESGAQSWIAPMPLGRYGVQLFFIISGYVILLTFRRSRSLKEFAVSRFARLYPAFWVGCILTYSATALFRPPALPLREALLNLPMFGISHVRLIEGAYWTLREELWFYVAMGALVLTRRTDLALRAVACIVISSICDLRFTRWFSLFLIGMVLFDSRERFRREHAILLALCAIDIVRRSLFKASTDDFLAGWKYPVIVAVCAILVFAASRFPWLSNRVLSFLGLISYTLYLLHATIGQIIIERLVKFGWNGTASIATAAAFAIALATAVTFIVERPALRAIKARLARKQLPSNTAAISA